MDLTRSALEYISDDLAHANVQQIGDLDYSDKPLRLIKPPIADTVTVSTLSGLVELVKSEVGEYKSPLYAHVVSPTEVQVFDSLSETYRDREIPFAARAVVPSVRLNKYLDVEDALIQLKSQFVQSEDRDALVSLLGNITEDNSRQTGDDGFSQSVTVRKGISMKENKTVPSIVKLAPYRTFLEIQQPESDFLVRVHDGPVVALIEADGGAWGIEARTNIKEYLEEAFRGSNTDREKRGEIWVDVPKIIVIA